MKHVFSALAFALAALAAPAQELGYTLVGELETQGPPMAIAADANGGIYYTVFSFEGPNLSRCYYVADPLNENAPETHVLVDGAEETEEVAGRGFTGIAVDGAGNVFLALESGANDTATVRKLSPAPDFEPVEEFFGGIVYGEQRFNGLDLMNDEILILSTFGTVEFWNAVDSTPLYTVSGGESFQRDVAYNPNNGDIYIAKNRDVAGAPYSAANIVRGNGPDDLESYAEIEAGFIPQGGAGGQYGVNAQLVEYDPVNDLILIPDQSSGEQPFLAMYSPDNTATPVISLDGSESENGPMDTPADSVAITGEGGETLVFVTDHGLNRILVYCDAPPTGVSAWELF